MSILQFQGESISSDLKYHLWHDKDKALLSDESKSTAKMDGCFTNAGKK